MKRDISQTDPKDMILYQDADLVVIDKPAGLLSIQDGYDPALPHLARVLEPLLGKVWIIHRLDKDTSGVLVLGRNAEAHRFFNEAFKERSIEKTYHAFVLGQPEWDEKLVEMPLKVNADRLHRTRVNEIQGKPARTGFKVLKRWQDIALLECQLFTGYTHQIRAHLFALDLPILGDTLYCQKYQRKSVKELFDHERLALHAYSISFIHPKTGEKMQFQADHPAEFEDLLKAD